MNFTYKSYENLLELIEKNGYTFSNYFDWNKSEKSVIMRHDIDISLETAVKLSYIEKQFGVVKATYFVLLTTDHYNIASRSSRRMINEIVTNGGNIGLHFDETAYEDCDIEKMVQREASLLSDILQIKINTVSMHRPSESTLEADYSFNGIVNSYGETFFKDFKYVSDSRMHWRENIEEIIKQKRYNRLHILTHAFWYREREQAIHDIILNDIEKSKIRCFQRHKDNIRDISEIITEKEILQ